MTIEWAVKSLSKENFTICVNSQAALKVVCNVYHEQILIITTQDLIQKGKKRVTLKWVKALVGTQVNEEAVRVAKEATTLPPQTSVGLSWGFFRFPVKTKMISKWQVE